MRTTHIARRLRRDMTDAERKLWSIVRNRQMSGVKFRRQVPIDRFVVDFASVEARVVVELDGGQHAIQAEADEARTATIEKAGYVVLRFWNNDVLDNIEGAIATIEAAIKSSRS